MSQSKGEALDPLHKWNRIGALVGELRELIQAPITWCQRGETRCEFCPLPKVENKPCDHPLSAYPNVVRKLEELSLAIDAMIHRIREAKELEARESERAGIV
jgi:hypothetical protein